MLNSDDKKIIKQFFEITEKLHEKGIVRTTRYVGDIGEHIIENYYGIILNKNKREIGYDGKNPNKKKVQIKINNSPRRTNVDIGDSEKYHILYLILTKRSYLFDGSKYKNAHYIIYSFNSKELAGKKYIARRIINNKEPSMLLDENLDKI